MIQVIDKKTSSVASKFLSNRCSTANNKIRDIRAIRVQEKSVFSVPSVGAETSENNKRIYVASLLTNACYDDESQ